MSTKSFTPTSIGLAQVSMDLVSLIIEKRLPDIYEKIAGKSVADVEDIFESQLGVRLDLTNGVLASEYVYQMVVGIHNLEQKRLNGEKNAET